MCLRPLWLCCCRKCNISVLVYESFRTTTCILWCMVGAWTAFYFCKVQPLTCEYLLSCMLYLWTKDWISCTNIKHTISCPCLSWDNCRNLTCYAAIHHSCFCAYEYFTWRLKDVCNTKRDLHKRTFHMHYHNNVT